MFDRPRSMAATRQRTAERDGGAAAVLAMAAKWLLVGLLVA